jgi:hypothetical protein
VTLRSVLRSVDLGKRKMQWAKRGRGAEERLARGWHCSRRLSTESRAGWSSSHSHVHGDRIARRLNDRPRKTHGWRSPAEAFAKESAKAVAVGPLVKAR